MADGRNNGTDLPTQPVADGDQTWPHIPLVVPIGYHCAPSIVNDVLGHEEGRPRMRTPFSLGVFPPDAIADLLRDGLSAHALVARDALTRSDGSRARFADDRDARSFGHGVVVHNRKYGFIFNHDFSQATADEAEDGELGVLTNHPWVHSAYEAKASHLRAMLRASAENGIVLCSVASPLCLPTVQLSVPGRAQVVAAVSRALAAMRKLAADEGAVPGCIAGAVVLFGCPARAPGSPPPGSEPGGSEEAEEAEDVAVEELPSHLCAKLHGYGQIPVPARAELYREVYAAFLRAALRLRGRALGGRFPPWGETRFFTAVLAPRVAARMLRKKPCGFFAEGRCHFGDRCRFAHQTAGVEPAGAEPAAHACRLCDDSVPGGHPSPPASVARN